MHAKKKIELAKLRASELQALASKHAAANMTMRAEHEELRKVHTKERGELGKECASELQALASHHAVVSMALRAELGWLRMAHTKEKENLKKMRAPELQALASRHAAAHAAVARAMGARTRALELANRRSQQEMFDAMDISVAEAEQDAEQESAAKQRRLSHNAWADHDQHGTEQPARLHRAAGTAARKLC